MTPSKRQSKLDSDMLGEITRPSKSATLKIGTPTIRVGLSAASAPKSSMIKVIGTKKNPTMTNAISNPKIGKMVGPKK